MVKFFIFLLCIFFCNALPSWGPVKTIATEDKEEVIVAEKLVRAHYINEGHGSFIRDVEEKQVKFIQPSNVALLGFSYKDCGLAKDSLHVKTLEISDPIVVPGNSNVTLDANISEEVTNITSAVVVLKKSIFGVFVDVPCVDNLGSCTYQNICPMLEKIKCPEQLVALGFKCHCPFPVKHFALNKESIKIPKIPNLPASLADGTFQIQVTLMNGSAQVACLSIEATIKIVEQ